MPTVVIIHAADDALPARALAEKLRYAAKLTVTVEKPPGEELRGAVRNAAVTIALWSPRSTAQADLVEEVAYAKTKSKVVHALMQRAEPPEQFRDEDPVNLTGWRGEEDFAPWRELAQRVAEKAGVALAPPPPPRPPSGFFQPGRPAQEAMAEAPAPRMQAGAPRPAAPRAAPAPSYEHRPTPPVSEPPRYEPRALSPEPESSGNGGARALIIGAIAFVVIALAGGGGYWFWSQSQATQTASSEWENVDRNDPGALRAFIAGNSGSLRDEARAVLSELEERSYEAASDADTIEALEAFVRDFPDSQHALAARGRIAELRTLQEEPPAEEEALTAEELVEPPPAPDPDLVPPGSIPDASGGPAPLTPPPSEEPAPVEPAPDEPVN